MCGKAGTDRKGTLPPSGRNMTTKKKNRFRQRLHMLPASDADRAPPKGAPIQRKRIVPQKRMPEKTGASAMTDRACHSSLIFSI